MTRVRTGSRLHFGLIRLPPDPWPADGRHYFGGLGLMVDEPAVEVEVTNNNEWSFAGAHAGRAERFVNMIGAAAPKLVARPKRLRVLHAPPEHCGFGLGTQLGLAVARALAATEGIEPDVATLAAWTGRGRRSAIGVHGFAVGGLIRDGGKANPEVIGALASRRSFPDDWRILIALPRTAGRWAGDAEAAAFAGNRSESFAERLEGLADAAMGAVARSDFPAFAASVAECNALAGEQFRAVQGGRYSSPKVEAAVGLMAQAGATGAGQSSWGPGVYGFVPDPDDADRALARLRRALPSSAAVLVTRGRNAGPQLGA
jgi:beta-RFAP synthase